MSDQKYRQPGYRDDDRSESRSGGQRPAGPREEKMGPRGRGLGKPTASVFRCAVCGTQNENATLGVDATCQKCRADLHTCTHCLSFDTSSPNECRQRGLAPVRAKAKRNECGGFQPKVAQEQAQEKGGARDARSAFDALFKI